MNKPKVSVLMNCLNNEKFLREAIDSVYAQTFKDWEIIFWEDSRSNDSSSQIAQSYDDKLRYFKSSEVVGLGELRNQAIKQAQGEYIAFLDCDDLWLPDKLEKQIPLFDNNPRIGLVISDTIFFDEKGPIKQLYKKKKPPTGNVFKHLLTDYFISLETAVMRKAAMDSLDEWFDKRFFMVEETDLFIRILHNWELGYVDQVLAKWRIHGANWSYQRKELAIQEKELLMEKLSQIYPKFETLYKNDIEIVKAQIAFRYAMLDWSNKKGALARKRLKPYFKNSRRYKLLYLLTFFPYFFYKKVYKMRGMESLY